MRVRLLHASKCWLDAPVRGLAHLSGPFREALRDASTTAFANVVETAMEHQVDAVLFAGGTYDGPRRGIRAQRVFSAGVEQLAAVGIDVIIVTAPDDPAGSTWTAIDSWPDRVHLVEAGQASTISVTRSSRPIALIHAAAAGADLDDRLRRLLDAETSQAIAEALPRIGLCAADPGPLLDDPRISYWAMGSSGEAASGETRTGRWGRPGTPQGRRITADHTGPKGCFIVDLIDGVAAEPVFVETHAVPILQAVFNASACSALSEITNGLTDQAERNDDGPVVMVPIVTGSGPLVRQLAASADARARVLESLRDRVEASIHLWWDHLEVRPSERYDATGDHNGGSDSFSHLLVATGAELGAQRSMLTDRWLDEMPPDVLALVGSSGDERADADWDAAVASALRLLGNSG